MRTPHSKPYIHLNGFFYWGEMAGLGLHRLQFAEGWHGLLQLCCF